MWKLTAICLAGTFFSTAAVASETAMVTRIGGKHVSWQHAGEVSKPQVQTILAEGDAVAAGKGSFVEVEFLADGCKVRIKAGEKLTVSSASPCTSAEVTTAAPLTVAVAKGDAQIAAPVVVPAADVPDAAHDGGTALVRAKDGAITRVNRGDGLSEALVGDNLKVGDEVYAGPESSVTLYFTVPMCEYTIPAGTIFTVPPQPPCEAATLTNSGSGGTAQSGLTGSGVVGGGIPAGVVAAGVAGVVVVGTAALVAINSQKDNGGNRPVTPD